jgi:small subunit ribosomal protein S4
VNKRQTIPGQHGAGRRGKPSNFGIQLREKQKVKRFYGMLESQFRSTYVRAAKMDGITGENFLRLLELRFDNVIYRMGLASSRKEARQLVNHGHFLVNGKKANIPSMTMSAGDKIEVIERSRNSEKFKTLQEKAATTPSWVSTDYEKLSGEIVGLPNREDIDLPIEEHLIIELYSK